LTGISQTEIEGFIELLNVRGNLNHGYAGVSTQWNKTCEKINKIIEQEYDRITGQNSEWSIKIKRTRNGKKYVFFSDHTKPYTIKMMTKAGFEWKNGWVEKKK
jgi:hypothetical protein